MANFQVPAATEEPIVAQTGEGGLAVDDVPLATGWDAGPRDVDLKRPNALCMVLEPRKRVWPLTIAVVLGLCAASIVSLVFTLLPGFERNAPWGLRAFSVFLAALFVGFLLWSVLALGSNRRWLHFDRASGLFTTSRRPFWLFWRPIVFVNSRPLKDLVGVQVIDCGWQHYSYELGEPGTPGSVVAGYSHGYQLNLILNVKPEPRLNIARHSDGQWMRDAGRQLADFLNVPYFDGQAPVS
jgi:hypothetical protein